MEKWHVKLTMDEYHKIQDAGNRAAALATIFERLSNHADINETFDFCELSGFAQMIRGIAGDVGITIAEAETVFEDEVEPA